MQLYTLIKKGLLVRIIPAHRTNKNHKLRVSNPKFLIILRRFYPSCPAISPVYVYKSSDDYDCGGVASAANGK